LGWHDAAGPAAAATSDQPDRLRELGEIMHHETQIYAWKDLSRKAKASQIHMK
jgi:hypothetical protein